MRELFAAAAVVAVLVGGRFCCPFRTRSGSYRAAANRRNFCPREQPQSNGLR